MRILRADSLDAALLAHGLDVIDRNTRLQARLIEDLLDVSRAIAGKVDLDIRPVQLAPVLEAAIDAARPAADAKQIGLQAVVGAGGTVSGDRDRLGQIVSNLLTKCDQVHCQKAATRGQDEPPRRVADRNQRQ